MTRQASSGRAGLVIPWVAPLALLFLPSASLAEEAPGERTHGFVAAEILAPLLGGFDVEVGVGRGKNKASIEYRQLELPEIYNSQADDFRVEYKVVELSYARFLLQPAEGLYAAAVLDYYARVTVTQRASGDDGDKSFASLSLRAGYVWLPLRRVDLYVEPMFQVGAAFNDEDVTVNGQDYRRTTIHVAGPMLHVGYRF